MSHKVKVSTGLVVTATLGISLLLITSCKNNSTQNTTQTKSSLSLKDAFTSGKSVQCSYKDQNGEVTVSLKDKKIKVEGIGIGTTGTQANKGGMINNGEWIYLWGEEDNSGIKYQVTNQENDMISDDWKNPEKWTEATDSHYNVSCKEAVLADSSFTPPSSIEFKDLSVLFQTTQ